MCFVDGKVHRLPYCERNSQSVSARRHNGKKAIVVGIDEYHGSLLLGCVNDAKEVAALLERNLMCFSY